MHYYQFNIGDYASHTRHLEPMEDLIYRRLLDLYYLHERPLNEDASVVAKQIGLRDMAATVLDVLNEFFERTEDGYRSARADKEIENYKSMSEAGKRGAAIRWSKGSNSPPIATPLAPPIANNNHKPITNIKREVQPAVDLPDWLDRETWAALVDMRKRIKKPMTYHAQKLMLGKLQKMKEAGHDIKTVMEKTIVNSWLDVYEPKASAQPTSRNSYDALLGGI